MRRAMTAETCLLVLGRWPEVGCRGQVKAQAGEVNTGVGEQEQDGAELGNLVQASQQETQLQHKEYCYIFWKKDVGDPNKFKVRSYLCNTAAVLWIRIPINLVVLDPDPF